MNRLFIRMAGILLALAILAGAALPGVAAASQDTAGKMLSAMSTEEKIAQMIMPSIRYYNGRGVTEMNDRLDRLFKQYPFAGAILFAQNTIEPEQTLRLTDGIQKANAVEGRPQLFIAIDQEGGRVTRLATGTQLTGNMALGAVGSYSAAKRTGEIIGAELSSLGINVNFAPVLDINSNPANPVIGTRSFSDDPITVSRLGTAYIKGLHSAGVITSLKHFPGHGDTEVDSHTGLPLINKTYAELKSNELIPFSAGISAGTEMIMTAHIQYPKIEGATYKSKLTGEDIYIPATLSEKIISSVLRGDMGYKGLVVTDAMNMDAIAKHFDPLDAMALSVNAGVDIILMPGDLGSDAGIAAFEKLISDTASLAENGVISMDKVNDAVLRILTVKEKHGLTGEYKPGDVDARAAAADSVVGSKAHHDEEFEIAKRAVTLTKTSNDLLPFREKNQKILILTAYENELLSAGYGRQLAENDSLIPEGTQVSIGCYGTAPAQTLLEQISQADVVIAISELTKASGLNPASSAGAMGAGIDRMIQAAHQSGAAFVVLSAHLPYDCVRFPDADAVMLCWSDKGMTEDPRERERDIPQYGPCIPAAIYMMFAKDEKITGRLPVNIPAINGDYSFSDEIELKRGYGLDYKDYCPLCGETHEGAPAERIRGIIHKIIHAVREFFDFVKDRFSQLAGRVFRSESKNEYGI